MDYQLNDDQRAIDDAVAKLLERHAGPGRAREVVARGDVDRELLAALDEGGYLDLFRYEGDGPLNATLVAERAACTAGLAPVAARLLIAPALVDGELPHVVAVADRADPGPVRYAAQAELLLVIDGDEVIAAEPGDWVATPVKSKFGYPLARVDLKGGRSLGSGTAPIARSWWQVALAAEAAGAARAALELTVQYLGVRNQFGRPLGTFQSLQHRLAECHVAIEGCAWLARHAAWHGAAPERAAAAAIMASEMAGQVQLELHQMSGAIGFTTEYDLHLYTMRLEALRVEAGGVNAHADVFARARWAG